MTDDPSLIEAAGIDVAFGGRRALSQAAVTVRRGEIVSLIGPNGAGKTTLVRVVLGLLAPDAGDLRRAPGLTIGYMPQRLHIEPTLPITVGRLLRLALPRRAGDREAQLRRVLDEVQAGHILDSPLQTVSGGEMQRVMLARALLRDPDLLVLDEPVQGVDVGGQSDLYRLIGRIRDERGCAVLMVSHDLHLVMAATDQVVCLNGHVCCAGHPQAVSEHPEYVALFGERAAGSLAVYHHHHDHRHDLHGRVIRPHEKESGGGPA